MKSILSLLLIMYIITTAVHGVEIIDTITASQTITGLTMANGHLWAGTSGGILRYSEVLKFVGFYTSKSGLPDNNVIDVAAAGSRIFAITRTGLVEYDPTGDRFQSVITSKGSLETESSSGSEFAAMAIAGRTLLLVMADTRIFVGDLATYPLDLRSAGRLEGTFTALTSDLSGMFWIGTREGSVFEIDNTGKIMGSRKFSRPIQSLNIADDLLFAGTADTLYACSRDGVRIQRPLPIDDVVSVIPDQAGIISISGKGVFKGKIFLNGKPILDGLLHQAGKVTDSVVLITRDPGIYDEFSVPVYNDLLQVKAPINGIYTALIKMRLDYVLILAIDLPGITSELLTLLLNHRNEYNMVIPRINGMYEPLCAVYSRRLVPLIEKNLNDGIYKPLDLMRDTTVCVVEKDEIRTIGDPGELFLNVNTPEDLQRARLNPRAAF